MLPSYLRNPVKIQYNILYIIYIGNIAIYDVYNDLNTFMNHIK